jgi:hypothetical protein
MGHRTAVGRRVVFVLAMVVSSTLLCGVAGAAASNRVHGRRSSAAKRMAAVRAAASGMAVSPTGNAAALATALLGSGVSISGTPTFAGAAAQAGTFSNAPALVGFPSGIVLSSGHVADAATTYIGEDLPDTGEGTAGNALLTAMIGEATNDAAVLTFSFIPNATSIYFKYTFASAEYPNYIGEFNDAFGFFVNGTNRALLPGTNTPVSINNVNMGTNAQYFNKYNTFGDLLSYGGETKVLTFTAPVNAGQVNTITIAVADALDDALDSAVFIQAGSLTTAPPPSTVPLPPSLWLVITGLGGSGLIMARGRFRRRD